MSLQLLCLHTKFCQNPPLTASSLNNNKLWGLVLHQHFNFLMKNWPSFFLACEHPDQYHSCLVIQQKEITVPATAIWLRLPVLDAILTRAAQAAHIASPSPSQQQDKDAGSLVLLNPGPCHFCWIGDVIQTRWLGGCREVHVLQKEVGTIFASPSHPFLIMEIMTTERDKWQALNVHCIHLASFQSKALIKQQDVYVWTWGLRVLVTPWGPRAFIHLHVCTSWLSILGLQICWCAREALKLSLWVFKMYLKCLQFNS